MLGLAFIAEAQTYTIDWHKIAGGGGAGAGGNYSLAGTIGQHDASTVGSGGQYSITGGFWVITQVVQTSGAPTLFIGNTGNAVTIFWQDVPGWNLQQNGDLTASAGWTASSGYLLTNGTNVLTLTSQTGNLFFRLVHP